MYDDVRRTNGGNVLRCGRERNREEEIEGKKEKKNKHNIVGANVEKCLLIPLVRDTSAQ